MAETLLKTPVLDRGDENGEPDVNYLITEDDQAVDNLFSAKQL